MVRLLILLCIAIPALEVILLMISSHFIGILPTFLMIIATGIIGAYVAKKQGIVVLREIQQQLQRGQVPTESLLDGACILIGGVLLLTPGYVTDVMGALFFIPATRNMIKYSFIKWIDRKIRKRNRITIWK